MRYSRLVALVLVPVAWSILGGAALLIDAQVCVCISGMAATPGSPPTGWTGVLMCSGSCDTSDPCQSRTVAGTYGGQSGNQTVCSCSSAPSGTFTGFCNCQEIWWAPTGGHAECVCVNITACPQQLPLCARIESEYIAGWTAPEPPPPGKKYYSCSCQ